MTQRSIVFMEPNEKPNADGSRELRHGLWKARPQWPARLVGLIVDGRDFGALVATLPKNYNEGPAAPLDGPRLQCIEVGNACELHAPEHLRRDGVTVGLSLSFVAQALRDAPPPVQAGEEVRVALLERVELVGLVLERIAIMEAIADAPPYPPRKRPLRLARVAPMTAADVARHHHEREMHAAAAAAAERSQLVAGLSTLLVEWSSSEVQEEHRSGLRIAAAQLADTMRREGLV